MNEPLPKKPASQGVDWFSVLVGTMVPLTSTFLDPRVSLPITAGLLLAMALYYRKRSPLLLSWALPAAGAAFVLAALAVLLLVRRH